MTQDRIDFAALAAANPIADVIGAYLDLKRRGSEWKASCPFHRDGRTPNLAVVPAKNKAFCNACGWHGDALDFIADFEHLTTPDGKRDVRAAAAKLGHLPADRPAPAAIPPDDAALWVPLLPAPAEAPAYDPARTWNPRSLDRRSGAAGRFVDWTRSRTRLDAYRDAAGALLGYVVRLEFDGTKLPMTVTYCRHAETGEQRWCAVKFPSPRPLQGLDDLAARPQAKVLVVSGEKCREAAARALPAFVVVTWPGGDQNAMRVDWSPLRGRSVTFWPDLDRQRDDATGEVLPYERQSGVAAMTKVAASLVGQASELRVLDLRAEFEAGELAGGWDVADAVADGWTGAEVAAFCRARVRPFEIHGNSHTPHVGGNSHQHPAAGAGSDEDAGVTPQRGTDDGEAANGPAPAGVDDNPTGEDARMDYLGERDDGLTHETPSAPKRDWPDPINLLGQFEPPIIRAEWLPEPLVDFVFDQAELLGCDPSIVGLSCIVSCAAALHDGIEIQPKRHDPTWTEQARLWGAIVGDPSTRKTPAMKKATSHLRKIDMVLAEKSAARAAEFDRQAKVDKKLEAAWIKAQASGRASGTPPQPQERPPQERVIAEDITVEALSNVLKDNARGVLVMTDELSGWFGSMDAYKAAGGKDRGLWLEAYNGGPKRVDRVMRGSILVPNWSASILGGIQPEAIRKVSGQLYDDGLLQRFMPVCGRSINNGVQDRSPNLDALKHYRGLLDEIFAALPSDNVVRLSDNAHEYREAVSAFSHNLATADLLTTSFRSHLGKWDGLFARLLLTFHAIDCRSRRRHPADAPVTAATAKRVHDFMRQFLFPHAAAFYMGILGRSDRDTAVEWIAAWVLAERLEHVSLREVMQSYKRWRAMPDWQQKLVMRSLEDAGWLIATGETSERRPNRWAVNPKVHVAFGRFAEASKASRERSREAVREAFSMVPRDKS